MARRARPLLILAALLAALPASAAVPGRAVVSARDGDLFVGANRITSTAAVDGEPDWSPDRRRIAFVRQEPGARSSSLYVVRRDGGGLRRLTSADEVVAMPAWSGDGRRIAYAAGPLAGGSFDVWTVSRDGGAPRRVATGPAEQIAPAFARSGKVTFRTLEPGEPFPEKTSDAGTPQVGPRELLPDFDQRPPSRLTISGTRLSFASSTDNVGEGPIWIRGSRASTSERMLARQLVPLSDGTVRTYEDAGSLRYTPETTHVHWHLMFFQRSEIRTADGNVLVRDRKTGFCLADHSPFARTRVANFGPPRFLGDCNASQPGALATEQGSSPGYTDVYPPWFHGQSLDLAGIPAGEYVLVHRANADERLEELDYTNNAASLRFRLSWSGGSPRVETLRTCPASAEC